MSWLVDLEADPPVAVHPEHSITIQFVEMDGEWRGMLGPTNFQPSGGLPLAELPGLLKEADDAFREAKGLPLQSWDFLEEEEPW